jgi:uncharacterized protein
MHRQKLELAPGLWLDARRAVWLAEWRMLAVADLHLGYVWAHRAAGQMLPISARDDTLDRLAALIADYAPERVALLGDIVHQAVPLAPLEAELTRLRDEIGTTTTLHWLAGNHDRRLAKLLGKIGGGIVLERELSLGPHRFAHGDGFAESEAVSRLAEVHAEGGRWFIGHEHPAVTLGDGLATRVRCPCFLVAPALVVLPAFSSWAAGGQLGADKGLSAFTRAAQFTHRVAIAAGKLLPIPA